MTYQAIRFVFLLGYLLLLQLWFQPIINRGWNDPPLKSHPPPLSCNCLLQDILSPLKDCSRSFLVHQTSDSWTIILLTSAPWVYGPDRCTGPSISYQNCKNVNLSTYILSLNWINIVFPILSFSDRNKNWLGMPNEILLARDFFLFI